MLSEFTEIQIPATIGTWPSGLGTHEAVYVLLYCANTEKTPFYVGQTENLSRRMNDYDRGHFCAPTDFRINTAVNYLKDNGYTIYIKYKSQPDFQSEDVRRNLERKLIMSFLIEHKHLLNSIPGYNYKRDENQKDEIQEQIKAFCSHYLVRDQ